MAELVGTGKMIGKAAIGVATMAIDQKLAEGGDVDAMMRQGQRAMGIANTVRHPIDTVVEAHTQAADRILEHEQEGEWFQVSIEAGETGSADAAVVVGAVEGGAGSLRLGGKLSSRLGAAAAVEATEAEVAFAEVAGASEPASSTLRTFTSTDPLVADLANKIEAMYPGHVVDVNVPLQSALGATAADVLLQNAVVQVKSGGGLQGVVLQLQKSEAATGLPSVAFGPSRRQQYGKHQGRVRL